MIKKLCCLLVFMMLSLAQAKSSQAKSGPKKKRKLVNEAESPSAADKESVVDVPVKEVDLVVAAKEGDSVMTKKGEVCDDDKTPLKIAFLILVHNKSVNLSFCLSLHIFLIFFFSFLSVIKCIYTGTRLKLVHVYLMHFTCPSTRFTSILTLRCLPWMY